MINLVIDILKANSTLTNLVDANNIYPLIQLQGGTIPSVVVQLTGTDPNDTQDKVSTYDNNSIEITSMAISPAAAWAISEAVRASIDGYSGGLLAQIRFQSQATDVFESTEVFSVTQSYSIHLKRDGATLPIAIQGLGAFEQTLDEHTDVTIEDPIDRQTLAYDEATGEWINDGAGSISIPVFNNLNEDIVVGRPLSAIGAQGDRISVEPYQTTYGALRFVGIAGETIAARSNGHATVYGEIRGLDTSNFPVGTLLYPLEGINESFYPFGLFSWVEGTNADPLVCAIVTRQQQNTGRIFVRMWSPGYRNNLNRLDDVVISNPFQGALLRYDSDQGDWRVPPQTSKTILEAATETVEIYYYSITTDTQQFRSAQSDTPSSGNKIVRKIWYSTTAQEDIDSGTWILLETLADNATYADLVTAFEDQLKTSPGGDTPISIKTTWEEEPLFSGLLDDYPGAAAAYSLRLLDEDYSGDAIRVRRASDNAEQDIGFDANGNLDTSSLATFCSGTDGFVKIWYDQSGNGRDATQTTTSAQPKIYDASTGVVLENGKPAVDYTGSEILNTSTFSLIAQPTTRISVGTTSSPLSSFGEGFQDGNAANRQQVGYESNGNWRIFAGTAKNATTGPSANTTYLMYALFDGLSSSLHVNSSFIYSDNTGLDGLEAVALGGGLTSSFGRITGKLQETVIYPSDQSTNRTGIETNINDYYSIYTP